MWRFKNAYIIILLVFFTIIIDICLSLYYESQLHSDYSTEGRGFPTSLLTRPEWRQYPLPLLIEVLLVILEKHKWNLWKWKLDATPTDWCCLSYFIWQLIIFKFPDFEIMVILICLKQLVYGIVKKPFSLLCYTYFSGTKIFMHTPKIMKEWKRKLMFGHAGVPFLHKCYVISKQQKEVIY